jgi:ABC-type Co2+ transport system permease subunit
MPMLILTKIFSIFLCNEKLQQTHTHSLGFIVGIVLCSIFLGPIASAVNTVIVLFAGSFQLTSGGTYPELSNRMRTAWMGVYPGSV